MIEEKALSKYGNSTWKVTTAPAVEPITVDELKLFARIDGTEEDDLIETFISTVRDFAEKYTGRAFISQTITLKMDFWPGEVIELPRPPLQSITAIETLDEDDTATEYDSSNYYTITEDIPGRLCLKQSVTFPNQTGRSYGGYQIRFVAGYGDSASNVPSAIKNSLMLWATKLYEDRVISSDNPPPEVKAILNMYRILKIGEIP